MKEQKEFLKNEYKKQRTEVNFYGAKPSKGADPVYNPIKMMSESLSENKISHKRYEEMSPREKQKQKQDLLKRFKSNVMSMTSKPLISSMADKNMQDLIQQTLSQTDAFSQRLLERNRNMAFLQNSTEL